MAYWLFQGNPKYYRVIDAIRDFEQMLWLVTRYGKDMAPGDGVLVWKSGDKAGIYAIASSCRCFSLGGSVTVKGFFAAATELILYFLKSGSSANCAGDRPLKIIGRQFALLRGCSCLKVVFRTDRSDSSATM